MRSIFNAKKKGQVSLDTAPTVILIVGLVFLIMATIALVGEKYGDAVPSENSQSIANETITTMNSDAIQYVANIGACNFEDFAIVRVTNATAGGTVIDSANYTVYPTGGLIYSSVSEAGGFNNSNWNVSYSFNYAGAACNITGDLQTELGSNTSIAGIVLTISLIGIVLSILISVFFGIRRVGSRI